MNGDKYLFSDVEEKDIQMHIKMGDNGRYSVIGFGTVNFQREKGAPLTLRDVMYVLRLKKNLISVVMLEDRGFDLIYLKERHSFNT